MTLMRQASRWTIKAVGGLAANLALLTVWVDIVGLPAWVAILPNWVLISTIAYVVTDRWVFAELRQPKDAAGHARQFVGSESIMVASKLLNYGIYVALLPLVDYRVAWVIGAGVTFVLSFAGNRWWWTTAHSTTM